MNEDKKTVELKQGKKWIEEYTTTNDIEIYQSLSDDLIAKKINQCSYIKSIKRTPLYNGYQKILVTYDNDCRAIYIVKN